jgi:4-hydroxy-2-oxoheptanedioate aldolase
MKTRINHVLRKRAAGQTALGINVQTASPENVEMVGAAAYDFVVIDCEHGTTYVDHLTGMLRAADSVDLTPIVRVPALDPVFILRALDAGAMGVIVPNIASAEQARAAVAAAKYRTLEDGPDSPGRRGACPSTRANWHLATDWPEFAKWSNAQTVVWLLIESLQGAAAIDEILEVPGIGAIVPGQFDLAQSMGLQGDVWNPRVTELLRTIVAKAGAKGIDTVAVLLGSDPAGLARELAFWKEAGVTTYWVGGDRRLFTLALRQRMSQVQAGLLVGQPR